MFCLYWPKTARQLQRAALMRFSRCSGNRELHRGDRESDDQRPNHVRAIYETLETVLARGIRPTTAKALPARPQVSVKRCNSARWQQSVDSSAFDVIESHGSGTRAIFLEDVPHFRDYFRNSAVNKDGESLILHSVRMTGLHRPVVC